MKGLTCEVLNSCCLAVRHLNLEWGSLGCWHLPGALCHIYWIKCTPASTLWIEIRSGRWCPELVLLLMWRLRRVLHASLLYGLLCMECSQGVLLRVLGLTTSTCYAVRDSSSRARPQILVVEGLHPFYDDRVADLLDFKIYLDISDDVKFAWKVQRDMKERGHSEESIRQSIESRKPDFDAYIDPQKEKADVIIQVPSTPLPRRWACLGVWRIAVRPCFLLPIAQDSWVESACSIHPAAVGATANTKRF